MWGHHSGFGTLVHAVFFTTKLKSHFSPVKVTVPRDFRLLVFFMNQFPPSNCVYHYCHFEFFRKFAKKNAAQGAQPVSLTPVANGKNLQSEKFLLFCLDTFG